ncbi:MAG: hypothetical protein HRU70_10170 [Phycisphaeraceae bacterium]|nr:MAG: hypothetical protein HRU70_10170 [Phycisphaeraceae bacterium]
MALVLGLAAAWASGGCVSRVGGGVARPGAGVTEDRWESVLGTPAVHEEGGWAASEGWEESSRRDASLALHRTRGELAAPAYYSGESRPMVQRRWWVSQPRDPGTMLYFEREGERGWWGGYGWRR